MKTSLLTYMKFEAGCIFFSLFLSLYVYICILFIPELRNCIFSLSTFRLQFQLYALNISISILNCTSKCTFVPLQRRRCGNVIHLTMLQKHYFSEENGDHCIWFYSFRKWDVFSFFGKFKYLSNLELNIH